MNTKQRLRDARDGLTVMQRRRDRARAERALGRPLKPTEHVHHHSLTQLVICQDGSYHQLLHAREDLDGRHRLENVIRNRDVWVKRHHALLSLVTHLWPSHFVKPTRALHKTDDGAVIVCIHSPAGQLAYNVTAAEQMAFFAHLQHEPCTWDGHTAAQRQERLEALCVDAENWPTAGS